MQSGARSPARVGIDLGEQPVEYSALDRLLDESDKNSFARSQQRSIAPAHQAAGGAARQQLPDAPAHQAAGGAARQALPDAPAHQAAGGAARQALPDAPAHRAAGGAARQQLPDAPAHQANAGRRRQSIPGTADQLAAARARARRSAVERQRVLDSARLAKHVQRQLGARVAEATPASTNGKADSYSLPDDELRPGLAKPSTRANNLHRL
jgi:hypothetical protein